MRRSNLEKNSKVLRVKKRLWRDTSLFYALEFFFKLKDICIIQNFYENKTKPLTIFSQTMKNLKSQKCKKIKNFSINIAFISNKKQYYPVSCKQNSLPLKLWTLLSKRHKNKIPAKAALFQIFKRKNSKSSPTNFPEKRESRSRAVETSP